MYLPKLVMDRKSIRFINTDGDDTSSTEPDSNYNNYWNVITLYQAGKLDNLIQEM